MPAALDKELVRMSSEILAIYRPLMPSLTVGQQIELVDSCLNSNKLYSLHRALYRGRPSNAKALGLLRSNIYPDVEFVRRKDGIDVRLSHAERLLNYCRARDDPFSRALRVMIGEVNEKLSTLAHRLSVVQKDFLLSGEPSRLVPYSYAQLAQATWRSARREGEARTLLQQKYCQLPNARLKPLPWLVLGALKLNEAELARIAAQRPSLKLNELREFILANADIGNGMRSLQRRLKERYKLALPRAALEALVGQA